VVDEWRHGRTGYQGWQRSVQQAREAFARLHAVAASDVVVGSQVATFCGLVALSLAPGDRVVCAEEDFTSVLFPLLAQEARGVRVTLVPLERVADAVDGRTALVAVSAVQSADGRIADLDAIEAAAAAHGARTFIDATQACGWLPFDAARFDYVACATYKWLLGARGCAFMAVRPEAAERLTPHLAGWFAAETPKASYGGPLRLAPGARRLDVSPAWFSWVSQAGALELLAEPGQALRSEERARPLEPVRACPEQGPVAALQCRAKILQVGLPAELLDQPGHEPGSGVLAHGAQRFELPLVERRLGGLGRYWKGGLALGVLTRAIPADT